MPLTLLGRMEERGTGIRRMKSAMLDHGLGEPLINMVDGELVVILPGPSENLDRLSALRQYSRSNHPGNRSRTE